MRMTSQVVFKIDSKTKAQAMKRAKRVGIPLASYLRQAIEDFAEGKRGMAIVDDEPFTAAEKRALLQSRKDLKTGKLLSLDEFSRKLGFKNKH